MEVNIEPVYIKDLHVNNLRGNVLLELCYSIHRKYPGQIHGAQLINNVWFLYVCSNKTRAALIVSGIDLHGKHIDIFDDNPIKSDSKRSERIVIKDLPATLSSNSIMSFLRGFFQLTIKSKVIYAKERMGGDEMSPFINGDRLVYVTPNVSPPLPKETVISGFPCRIWHASQKNYCKRCAQHGHRTADVDICESYDPDAPVVAFRSDSNPLSNYYPCDLLHNGMTFKSLEHYYQYEFCLHAESPEVANQVIAAPSAKVAKELSTDLKKNVTVACLANWSKIRVHIMEDALKLKWNCCSKFRHSLMSTSGMTIAEATMDSFWGVGVAPNMAQETKPAKFLGFNQLGKLLMKMREHVAEREQFTNNEEFDLSRPDDNSPVTSSVSATTTELSDLAPPPLPSSSDSSSPTCPVVDSKPSPGNEQNLDGSECVTMTSPSKDEEQHQDSSVAEQTPQSTNIRPTVDSRPGTVQVTENASDVRVAQKTNVHDISSSSNESSTNIVSPAVALKPTRIPRRPRSKIALPSGKHGTLDNFVTRRNESPATKRKHSTESSSPSSVQVAKSTKTDGSDEVS